MHAGGVGGHAAAGVDEEVDQAPQQPDHLVGLAARRRAQIDAIEVEGAERGERLAAGSVIPTRPVRSIASSTACTNAPIWRDGSGPTTAATSSGRSSGVRMPARTASSKSWQTYAMRSAHATTSPSGVDGAGRRHEWLRTPSSVSAQRFSGASVTSAPYTAWS